MPSAKKPGIVLAPYGSLYPQAIETYDRIRKAYENEFPSSPILLAFTSQLMRTRLMEREGIRVLSPLAALAELHEMGCKSAVVQSLHIVPGKEFHQIALLTQRLNDSGKLGFDRIGMGMPLLSGLDDCMKVSFALPAIREKGSASNEVAENLMNPNKEAFLLVGHGTGHPADSQYSMLAQVLKINHRNVFLGTLEGFPGILDLMEELKSCGTKKVRLMPFLLVAGGHAEKDIASDDPVSWKTVLVKEGFEASVQNCGMGDSQEIVSIFLGHTKKALERLKIR